jgi:hypothetical protein
VVWKAGAALPALYDARSAHDGGSAARSSRLSIRSALFPTRVSHVLTRFAPAAGSESDGGADAIGSR